MKQHIEEIYDNLEEVGRKIKAWENYPIYDFKILPFGNKWKLIYELKCPMMG